MSAEKISIAPCLLRGVRRRGGTSALRANLVARRAALEIPEIGRLVFYTNVREFSARLRGRPLLLLHGVHPAASSHDLRPLFAALREERPVYAPDLPGFGLSERAARDYTPALYVQAIEALIEYVGAEHAGSARDGVDVVAVGLSCEYAAQAAVHLPDLVRSLLLISPTGFALRREQGRLERAARRGKRVLPTALLGKAGVSPLLYRALVSRHALKLALGKTGAPLSDELLRQRYETSHAPGAEHAVLALWSGQLFPRGNPQSVYTRVHCPTLIIHADEPRGAGFGSLACFVKWHEYFQADHVADVSLLTEASAAQLERKARAFWERVRELEREDGLPNADGWGEPAATG